LDPWPDAGKPTAPNHAGPGRRRWHDGPTRWPGLDKQEPWDTIFLALDIEWMIFRLVKGALYGRFGRDYAELLERPELASARLLKPGRLERAVKSVLTC
jgi:hypothetical protein